MAGRMKRGVAALLAALQLATLPGLAVPAFADGGTGLLRLLVYRPGMVWLDGAPVLDLTGAGQPPPRPWDGVVLQATELAAGSHLLRLVSTDAKRAEPVDERTFVLAAGDTVTVALGRPLLMTSPPGALVRLETRELGRSPLRLDPALLPGARLFLERSGYQPDTLAGDSLLARAREWGSLRLELAPRPGTVAMTRAATAPRRYLGMSRWTAFGVSTALVAAGVVGAARLKDRANDNFDRYRRTGDPARQREAFRAAERYDRLSLIGWGVAEVAFLSVFYLIIQESPRGLIPTVTSAAGVAGEPAWQVGVTHAF